MTVFSQPASQVSLRQVRIHMNSFHFQDVCPKMGNTTQNCHSTMGKMMKSFNFHNMIQSHKLLQVGSPLHRRACCTSWHVTWVNSLDFGRCRPRIGLSEIGNSKSHGLSSVSSIFDTSTSSFH